MPKLLRYVSAITAGLSALIWIYVFINNPLKSSKNGDCGNTDCIQGLLGEVGLFGLLMIVAIVLSVISLISFLISRKLSTAPPSG